MNYVVRGKNNPADMLTKHVNAEKRKTYCDIMDFHHCDGKAAIGLNLQKGKLNRLADAPTLFSYTTVRIALTFAVAALQQTPGSALPGHALVALAALVV